METCVLKLSQYLDFICVYLIISIDYSGNQFSKTSL